MKIVVTPTMIKDAIEDEAYGNIFECPIATAASEAFGVPCSVGPNDLLVTLGDGIVYQLPWVAEQFRARFDRQKGWAKRNQRMILKMYPDGLTFEVETHEEKEKRLAQEGGRREPKEIA